MTTKTMHVIPRDGGWTVRKEADRVDSSIRRKNGGGVERTWAARKPATENSSYLFPTQKQAIEAAREMAQRLTEGQIVVHNRDGSMQWRDVHGLPEVQPPPGKSDLGTEAIKKAVSAVIRERLGR